MVTLSQRKYFVFATFATLRLTHKLQKNGALHWDKFYPSMDMRERRQTHELLEPFVHACIKSVLVFVWQKTDGCSCQRRDIQVTESHLCLHALTICAIVEVLFAWKREVYKQEMLFGTPKHLREKFRDVGSIEIG